MAIHEDCPRIQQRRDEAEECNICPLKDKCGTGRRDIKSVKDFDSREKTDSFLDEIDKDNGR